MPTGSGHHLIALALSWPSERPNEGLAHARVGRRRAVSGSSPETPPFPWRNSSLGAVGPGYRDSSNSTAWDQASYALASCAKPAVPLQRTQPNRERLELCPALARTLASKAKTQGRRTVRNSTHLHQTPGRFSSCCGSRTGLTTDGSAAADCEVDVDRRAMHGCPARLGALLGVDRLWRRIRF